MPSLKLLALFGVHLTLLAVVSRAARVPSPSTTGSGSSHSRRAFAMAGFHEVQAPQLGRPGATPPPPPPVVPRYEVPEVSVNGFKPILGPRIPIQRRRQPESLDYGTDIITIYDVKPSSSSNDTLLKTVSSSLQVRREEANEKKRAGRVYEDVIYDLPVETQDFKPEESRVESKSEKKRDRLNGWRRIA